VLGCAAGKPNKEVAAEVGKWHQRFVVDQLAGLADEPRTGALRGINDDQIEDVIVATVQLDDRDPRERYRV
jgi:hypothetical protein